VSAALVQLIQRTLLGGKIAVMTGMYLCHRILAIFPQRRAN
jgi:hypothetical protein